jgi:WD40 repeat protein
MPVRNGLAASADGRFIVAATGEYHESSGHRAIIEVFGFETGRQQVLEDRGAVYGMWRVVLSLNDRLASTVQVKGRSGILARDLAARETLFRKQGFDAYWVRGLAISHDGRQVVSGDEKGFLRPWRVGNGASLLERQESMPIQSVAISSDNKRVAWSLFDGVVKVASLVPGSR